MRDIYRYNDFFDKNRVYDKIAELDEKIQDAEENEEISKEREKKIRELTYAQFLAGLRLNTGYNHF